MFTMGDWNTVAAPDKSETRFFSQINTESGMSPTCLFQSTLVLGKISPISTFCAEDNVEQCITYVDQELTTLGFPSLYAASKNGDARKLHVVSVVNCIHELLQRHLRNLRSREDTETQVLKLSSDLEYLQSSNSRLKDQLEITRRENNALQERDRQLQCKNRSLLQLLKNEKEEVQKLQNIIASRSTQYNHNMKRKERDYNKLKERLNQLVMDKGDKKMSIDVLNYVGRSDGKRSAWRTSKTDAKNEEDMYRVLLNDYEQRHKRLMLENAELKKVLQQMKKEMISILSPKKQKTKEKAEDSFGTVFSDVDEDVADSSKENLTELSCEIVREQLVNSIRQQWRILKNHVEKLDNQASLVHVASPDLNAMIKREDHEQELEKLKEEIQRCKETIRSQQHLLQKQLGVPSDDDTSTLLQDCYALEDNERLKQELKLFNEQKRNFERERRNFTEAAIRLGHEKKVFEEDRGAWLKQQFLNMTTLCDRKSSEHWKSPSAFFSPEQDIQKLHSRSNQNKQHYSSSRKILPATPTEHNQSQRDSSAKSGLYRRSDSSVSPTGSD